MGIVLGTATDMAGHQYEIVAEAKLIDVAVGYCHQYWGLDSSPSQYSPALTRELQGQRGPKVVLEQISSYISMLSKMSCDRYDRHAYTLKIVPKNGAPQALFKGVKVREAIAEEVCGKRLSAILVEVNGKTVELGAQLATGTLAYDSISFVAEGQTTPLATVATPRIECKS